MREIRPLIAGNWKMNGSRRDALKLAGQMARQAARRKAAGAEVLICPPAVLIRTGLEDGRWVGAESAGSADAPSEHASATWGLAARGARVEAGLPPMAFGLSDRDEVWTDDAARLYARAAAAQWDPETAIDWSAAFDLPEAVEDAVVQVMTYLVENETAALIVPARFLGQVHPHFREIQQVLAIQAADEARHIEVFTRRALLKRSRPGLSTVGGQTSLRTLLEEPDFALASFLLSVLGEGSFLSLLHFLTEHGPDPITRQVSMSSTLPPGFPMVSP